MKTNGKTIQIFLPNGDPKGVKKTEIKTDKIEVIQSSKKDFLENKELFDFTGLYVLVDSLQEIKPQIYIGKGRVKDRIYNHSGNKDFWNTVFAVKLKTEEGFNDGHISYLEHYFIDLAKKIDQSIMIDNKQMPICPKLEESIVCELTDYIETTETLLSTLGLKVFNKISEDKPKLKDVFECITTFGAYGSGEYTQDGFVVFKGAKTRREFTASAKGGSEERFANRLVEEGILVDDPENQSLYILTQDFSFSSPSLASTVIMARFSNGWKEWKNKDGKTLDEVYRSEKR